MKALLKLVCLVCLSCGALHAESYLVALQAPNGQYVCAEDGGGGGGDLNANRGVIGPWEMFIVENVNGGPINNFSQISIRALSTNMYWSAQTENKQFDIECNRAVRGPWEAFTFIGSMTTGSQIILRTCWDHYVIAENNGGGQVLGLWLGEFIFPFPITATIEDNHFTLTVLAVLPDSPPPPPPPPGGAGGGGGGGPYNEN